MALDPNTGLVWPPPEWEQAVDPLRLATAPTGAAAGAVPTGALPAPAAPAAPVEEVPRDAIEWPPPEWQQPQGATTPVGSPTTPTEQLDASLPPEYADDEDVIEMPEDFVGRGEPPAPAAPAVEEPPYIDMEAEQGPDYLDPLSIPDERTRVDTLAALPEDEYQRLKAKLEQERQALTQARELEAGTRALQEAHENARIYQEAVAKTLRDQQELEVEAKKLAETSIDEDQWMESRSAFQTAAAWIAAIVGGLVQHQTGGVNLGLQAIQRAIDRNIEVQKANLANRRDALARRQSALEQQLARHGDLYKAAETVRLASYEQVIKALEAERLKYNPEGTTSLQLADVIRQARAQQAELLRKYSNEALKQELDRQKYLLDVAKARQEQQKIAETERYHREQASIDRTRAAADLLRAKAQAAKDRAEAEEKKAENVVYSVEELRRRYPTAPPEAFAAGPMSLKDFGKHLEQLGKAAGVAKSGAELAKAGAEAEVKQAEARLEKSGPGGSPYAIGDQEGNAYRNKDGSVFEVKDATKRERIREINASAQNVRRIADLVKILRAKGGGASELLGSDEYQELKSLAAQLDFETFKGFGLGAPSEGDKALAEAARGGKDITSFIYDPSVGFESYAKGLEEKLTTEMRGAGYTGPAIKLKSIAPVKPEERTKEQNLDVYDSPLIYESQDKEVAKRAAEDAAKAVPALARQASENELIRMALANQERMELGLLDPARAAEVQRELRKHFRRLVTRGSQAEVIIRAQRLGGFDDASLDKAMGVTFLLPESER